MRYRKLIFTGPVGAGKSTAIASISDEPPVQTDAAASDLTRLRKSTTTVALDYGVLHLPDGGKIHLYGTPGQERFDFMWDILTEGGIGLILLIDNNRADPLHDLQCFLHSFRSFVSSTGLVVGVTRMDLKSQPSLQAYHRELVRLGFRAPVLEVDARRRADVSLLIQALLLHIDPGLSVEGGEHESGDSP